MKIKIICHFDTVEEMVHALQLITPAQNQKTCIDRTPVKKVIHNTREAIKSERAEVMNNISTSEIKIPDAIKEKVMVLCPVCKTPFEKKYARKYCSKKCCQKVSNANYSAQHKVISDKIKPVKTKIKENLIPIDPPSHFEPDPEPSEESDNPF